MTTISDFDSWLNGRAPSEKDEDELLPGTSVGPYKIVTLLGRGGFADVYRAKDRDNLDVAIKLLHRLDEKTILRFERESQILAQVKHHNFPKFLNFGYCHDRPYVVTELLQPYELPQTDRGVARFLQAIMPAIETLHRAGYVHRDIKPANVLARANGEPVVIDFGIATPIMKPASEVNPLSIADGKPMVIGTVGYSAPEQFMGQAADRSADVHALGMLINACFGEKIPRTWRQIYLKATNSNHKNRYQTVEEMQRAIARRHWPKIAIAAIVLVLVAVIGYFAIRTYDDHLIKQQIPKRHQMKELAE